MTTIPLNFQGAFIYVPHQQFSRKLNRSAFKGKS